MTELEKQQAKTIEIQSKQIEALLAENRLLKEKVDYIMRQLYGSKSEKLDASQLELLLDPDTAKKPSAADSEEDALAAENIISIQKGKPRKNNRRHRLPENLPVTEQTIIPDEVLASPDDYRQIGQEISEKLDVEPARYTRCLIIRPTFVSRKTLSTSPITAPLPPQLLENSYLTASLLAQVITLKYNDHCSFYRQQQILDRRHGIGITRATLCNWAELAAHTLQPLYNLIAGDIRQSDRINVDETPVAYLDRENGGSTQGYFWIYRSATAGVLYDWQTSRAHTCLDTILTNGEDTFTGVLQCDGYSAYETWAAKQEQVTLAGCWVHARRKFNMKQTGC